MSSLWFVVPAHGRVRLAEVCLRQLAWTCSTLTANGITASAVVIADDENLDTASDLGFATVERDNLLFGAKWNDGYELAAKEGVDFVVPFGTDDWIDPELLLDGLPRAGEMLCFRLATMVREDGLRAAPLHIPYDGGIGIRVYPSGLFAGCGYRPAEEDGTRAIDTNVLMEVTRTLGRLPRIRYGDIHQLQIIDWKSETQLNGYEFVWNYSNARARGGEEFDPPWEHLAAIYSAGAVEEIRSVYRPTVAA